MQGADEERKRAHARNIEQEPAHGSSDEELRIPPFGKVGDEF
jgi:hypothetical protein